MLAVAAALAMAFPAVASAELPRDATAVPDLESRLVATINALRSRHGLRGLERSPMLVRAARTHGRSMLAGGYFAHGDLPRRLSNLSTVGENLAWSTSVPAADGILRLWLASPPHRRNLLSPAWRRVGTGAVRGWGGGVYGNRRVTVIVADFGAP
jgi:uncharacterized protein YkwD